MAKIESMVAFFQIWLELIWSKQTLQLIDTHCKPLIRQISVDMFESCVYVKIIVILHLSKLYHLLLLLLLLFFDYVNTWNCCSLRHIQSHTHAAKEKSFNSLLSAYPLPNSKSFRRRIYCYCFWFSSWSKCSFVCCCIDSQPPSILWNRKRA